MASSYRRFTFNGSTDLVDLTFGYLDKSHVSVKLDGVLVNPNTYTWNTDSQIDLGSNPVNGTACEVRRTTPGDPLTEFQPGNLDSSDLNYAILQALFLAAEAADRQGDTEAGGWVTAAGGAGGTVTKGAEAQSLIYDASGNIVPGPTVADLMDAEDNADEATASAIAAAASEAQAQAWAETPEDTQVVNHPGSFSALHWAQKSMDAAATAIAGLAGLIHAATLKAPLDGADELPLADSAASWVLKKLSLTGLRDWLVGQGTANDYFEGFDATRVNNSQITFSAGTIKGNGRLATLAAPITKDLALAWVAGTGGGRDTGSEQAQAGVHYFVIQNIATPSSVDIIISHSATAPTIPAGWALVGRVFSYWNDASSNLVGFTQVNKRVYWAASVDWLSSYTGTIVSTVTGPPAAAPVPSGIRVDILVYATCRTRSSGTTTVACYDGEPGLGFASGIGILNYLGAVNADTVSTGRVRTTTTRQCRLGITNTGAGSNIDLTISGFDDYTLPKREKSN